MTMRKMIGSICLSFCAALFEIAHAAQQLPPPPPNDIYADAYVALQAIAPLGKAKEHWYYINVLRVEDDALLFEQLPAICREHKLVSSVSDGGFPVYRGTVSGTTHNRVATMKLESCDYCTKRTRGRKVLKDLPFSSPKEGVIKLGKLTYRRGFQIDRAFCPDH
ncbi:MAG: hypothetical protein E6Q34_06190 [Burkholderiaceae bacterium]|nr:MAG: hypothetical protein E6Q34_06190 [Burkholderiaceae bacterium]